MAPQTTKRQLGKGIAKRALAEKAVIKEIETARRPPRHALHAAPQELAEATRLLDLPVHRLHDRLAPRIDRMPRLRP